MKKALQAEKLYTPETWQEFPQGKWLSKQVERHLNQWWPRIFGYHLLKVGDLSAELDTSLCQIKHQVNVAQSVKSHIGVVADDHHLPFRENSVDAVLLAHGLDHSSDPHQLLREAHRVLIADGYLIITGFNPHSLCGMGRFLPSLKSQPPWSGRFFSPHRVTDWLGLLGCEVIAEERFIFRSLLNKPSRFGQRLLLKNKWLTRFSHQHCGSMATVYMLVARKRELPLTPIKPKWKVKAKLHAVNVGSVRSTISQEITNNSK